MVLHKRYLLALTLLIMAAMACAQAGEVLSPAEATARVEADMQATANAVIDVALGDTDIQIGDTVRFISSQYLVLLRRDPGTALIAVQSQRGSTGVVIGLQAVDEEIWFEIETSGGSGWLPEEEIEKIEVGVDEVFEVGDTAYLVGEGSTVALLTAPGNQLDPFEQDVHTEVTITQITELEGLTWYRVTTGEREGWVSFENVAAEIPSE